MNLRTAADTRKQLTPDIEQRWRDFSKSVFQQGALDRKTKQLIAVAVAHVTQCPDCLRGHSQAAKLAGADESEILEAIWVAAEMRAGGAVAHSRLTFEAISDQTSSAQTS